MCGGVSLGKCFPHELGGDFGECSLSSVFLQPNLMSRIVDTWHQRVQPSMLRRMSDADLQVPCCSYHHVAWCSCDTSILQRNLSSFSRDMLLHPMLVTRSTSCFVQLTTLHAQTLMMMMTRCCACWWKTQNRLPSCHHHRRSQTHPCQKRTW